MRWGPGQLGVLAGLALALSAASAAAAETPFGTLPERSDSVPAKLRALIDSGVAPRNAGARFNPAFIVKARDGYRIGVVGMGDAVLVGVAPRGGNSVTAYVARGTVTSRRLQASFGKFGSVAMRFRPAASRVSRKQRRRCRGAGRFMQRGVFVGNFSFEGENGYVSVRIHRARGRVSGLASRCVRSGSSRHEQRAIRPPRRAPLLPDPTFIGASWREGVDSSSFGAIEWLGKTLFFASAERSEGTVATIRIAFTVGSARAFDLNSALTFARVTPPPPFHGAGTYRAAPDGTTTWTGALSVNFPGAPRSPLTGPPFKPQLEDVFPGQEPPPFLAPPAG